MKTRWWLHLFATSWLAACHAHTEWVEAPATGDVASLVQSANSRAQNDRRLLVVYVGAKWCEPCERFHQAALQGALDQQFHQLRFYAFDFDRDAARLAAAGYDSPLIPLLVRPNADGRGGAKRMFGSIKGGGAVAEMTPRLQALIAE